MKKILGLDLGTNSIGWALVEQDFEAKLGKILGSGSRIIPMGTDKQDYEKGAGITKSATRREKRTARKMNKRYKLRRNKLLFILHALGMLPDQFQFKVLSEDILLDKHIQGIPVPEKLQELELLPVQRKREYSNDCKRKDRQYKENGEKIKDEPFSIINCELRVNALKTKIDLKDLGKIFFQFNQLRGYSGGTNDDDKKRIQKKDENDGDAKKNTYEVITQKFEILSVRKSDETFIVKRGENKGEKQNYSIVKIKLDDEEKEGKTKLQNLQEGQEEELEIRIKRNKKGEETSVEFALPQKTNWRKNMEANEKILKEENLFISELHLKDLIQNKWMKIRNRVFLRNRYKEEFDKVWDTQAKYYSILNDCPKETLEKIANYIFPGKSESQQQLKKQSIEKGLKYVIKEQIIYYQRPLKPQEELISNCRFEKEEKVIATSHPLFQEFRSWKQINNLYVTSKQEIYNEKKKKSVFQYTDRYLTGEQKQNIYDKLQVQKYVSFNDVRKIIGIKDDKIEYLNGLNIKAKLIGCDTFISIRKHFGEHFENFIAKEPKIVEKIWEVIFDVRNHEGSEYETTSKRVSSIIEILQNYTDQETATDLSLKLAQNIRFPRKYASLSAKAIQNILPLMKLNPENISEQVKSKFENIKQLIETGEITDNVDYKLEDYVIDFVKNNPNALENGGLMEYLAISLIYSKHTAETVEAQIKNYHDIKYEKRNLRNPIVEQLISETMQVIKAIWKQYKFNPEDLEIRVELARDLKNSSKERDKIYKGQLKNQKINENIKKRLEELKQEFSPRNIDLYKLWSKQCIEEYPKQSKEPTREEIEKMRHWEEQKCISPYTGKPIPLSKLFTKAYDIDHIIPKSRYYDDSFSNKVVCETDINEEKSNRTAWEYITQQNSKFGIFDVESFVNHINKNFFGKKKKNLLAEKIPLNPVERQLKDTQYISVAIKNELAKIVGSQNVKTSTGEVTAFLRSRWGLKKLFMKLTENRFKQMELWDLDENGNPKTKWIEDYFDKEKNKHVYEIKNWSKRYDQRHHAIDALVVALTEQSHIQRLNNLNKYIQEELEKRKDEFKIEKKESESILDAFFNLDDKRRDEILRIMESSRKFEMPFPDLIKQVREHLESMVVSHKLKDKLGIKIDEKTKKKQIKIRGALHEETYYGKLNGKDTKTIEIGKLSIKDISKIVDDVLQEEIENHRKSYESMREAFTGEGLKVFNEHRLRKIKLSKLKVKNVSNIEDENIKKDIQMHIEQYKSIKKAFNKEGLDKFNSAREIKIDTVSLLIINPIPVYKVKAWYNTEEKSKNSLQQLYGNDSKQSVITGDNYMFLVMEREGKRIFDIASLYHSVCIAKNALKENVQDIKNYIAEEIRTSYGERNKIKGKPQKNPDKVSFTLQQNELVYLPTNSDDSVLKMSNREFEEWVQDKENKKVFCKRVYKVVKFTGKYCFFIPNNYANTISVAKDLTDEENENLKKIYGEKNVPKHEKNYEEFGSFKNSTKTEVGENFVKELVMKKEFNGDKPIKIQDTCVKIEVDWLGNVKKV